MADLSSVLAECWEKIRRMEKEIEEMRSELEWGRRVHKKLSNISSVVEILQMAIEEPSLRDGARVIQRWLDD